ncbi:MAG TPA: hypothetical protein VIL88_03660 [Devosia sp.]|uniref:hypothetical protein n=1 Tax=Devosia sp. TaxID=1871048 RepID=UPI002F921443
MMGWMGRSAALVLVASVAGCVDATVEVDVASATDGTLRITQVIEQSTYDMLKSGSEAGEADEFCAEGELSVGGGSATCVISETGSFEELSVDEDGEEALRITSVGPGLVRVAIPLEELKGEVAADPAETDQETLNMIAGMFEGAKLTLKIGGGEITETNMDIGSDRRSAQKQLAFDALIRGDLDLPEEFFAVVRK